MVISIVYYTFCYGECIYTVAGELRINFYNQNYKEYQRILDLDGGLVKVNYVIDDNNHIERTYFASHPNNLIVINIKSDYPINFSIELDREKIFDETEPHTRYLFASKALFIFIKKHKIIFIICICQIIFLKLYTMYINFNFFYANVIFYGIILLEDMVT